MIPVVLSGGSGTRLWPLSRKNHPKQFLPLVSDNTMLQETLLRLNGLEGVGNPVVVCNHDHRFMVAEQLREKGINNSSILLEPFGRNTAPAVAMAAFNADVADDILLVLAADHVIADIPKFHEAVKAAAIQAAEGKLVTFGVKPTCPETGFGYIKKGGVITNQVAHVEKFIEKPTLELAQNYLECGDYLWNSGMFVFKASVYLKALEKYQPDIWVACRQALGNVNRSDDFIKIDSKSFEACPSDSIDYAVLEKADNVCVVTLGAGWNDVGSWVALSEAADKDGCGNVLHGDVLVHDSRNSYIYSDNKLVTAVGVDDLVVVNTDDAVMVASKKEVQNVKVVVELLKTQNRDECKYHRKTYRPWGWYDVIDIGDHHKAKRILMNPGASLSLQRHRYRAEHWIVVKGVAKVTRENETFLIAKNESTYIPVGALHRLENVGEEPLEMIEVQTGSYIGEDDISRFDDNYGRTEN